MISGKTWAQLPNAGFENWSNVTNIWGYSPFIASDTFSYQNPDNWTTLNQVTGNRHIGGNFFVSQTSEATSGNFGIRMETDTIFVSLLPDSNLILPGFAVNGNFQVDLAAILEASGAVSPAIFSGAGHPETNRKQKMRFKAKYQPVSNDSLLAWAVLKSSGVVIAEAKINSPTPLPVFTTVEADFVYFACEQPDTLVVMFGSSTPNFSTAFSGNSELVAGSVLIVDDIEFIDLPNNSNIPPVANFDEVFTFQNVPKTIPVLDNDNDCEGNPLQLAIAQQPLHGTAQIIGTDSIRYIPSANWAGADTLYYTISDGIFQAETFVRINVFVTNGWNEFSPATSLIIPNPSEGSFCLDLIPSEMATSLTISIVDLNGKLIDKTDNPCYNNPNLSKGIYFIHLNLSGRNLYRKLIIK